MKHVKDDSLQMDEKDRILLSVMQQNGQVSLSELGRKINLTNMAVSNRIKNLRELGIIEGSFTKISPEKVGQDYIVITRVICRPKGPEQANIADSIAKLPGVQSVYLVFGTFDILVIARRRDKTSAKRLIYDISAIRGVQNTETMVPHTVVKESLYVDTLSQT